MEPDMKLELRGITKHFGDLVANDAIDLSVDSGEIHALLGENGAGKSTLMNILYGMHHPDSGQILIDGVERTFHGPRDAIAAGIGMVHQHFMLIPVFTVAENVMLGHEWTHRPFGRLSRATARRRVRELSDRYGLEVDPDALISDLPVGIQQRVEVLKALSRDARVLILDEPTAVLTPREIDDLMRIMRELAAAGKAIVFITHKLREVRATADRTTVIRRGRVIGEVPPGSSEAEMARMMVGRDVVLTVPKNDAKPARAVLRIRDLVVCDDRGHEAVDHVSLDVCAGEIVAIAGVQGNGQEEFVECLIGLRPGVSGSVLLNGVETTTLTPRQILDSGVGYVPEDRQRDGVVGAFSVAENLALDIYCRPPFSRGMRVLRSELEENARQRIAEFDIRATSSRVPAATLSGGNQQKIVIARELSRPLTLIIASQPTRGLDVGAREFIHRRLIAERDGGAAVVIVSTELDEVMGLADRIAVIYRGGIVGLVPGDASREAVGLMMAGVAADEGASL
jgi:ABC-type uncharacterized transport system ATPase subunit